MTSFRWQLALTILIGAAHGLALVVSDQTRRLLDLPPRTRGGWYPKGRP